MSVLMREGNLWIANAGDSRAVLAKEDGAALKAVDLSVDQNPNSPKEQVFDDHDIVDTYSVESTENLKDHIFVLVFRCLLTYVIFAHPAVRVPGDSDLLIDRKWRRREQLMLQQICRRP